jgi:hypothetical protein
MRKVSCRNPRLVRGETVVFGTYLPERYETVRNGLGRGYGVCGSVSVRVKGLNDVCCATLATQNVLASMAG